MWESGHIKIGGLGFSWEPYSYHFSSDIFLYVVVAYTTTTDICFVYWGCVTQIIGSKKERKNIEQSDSSNNFRRDKKNATTECVIQLHIDASKHSQRDLGASSSRAPPPPFSTMLDVPFDALDRGEPTKNS